MADTFWDAVPDSSTPAATDTLIVRRPGTQNSNRGIPLEVTAGTVAALGGGQTQAQVDARIVLNALSKPVSLGSESIAFTDRSYKTAAANAVAGTPSFLMIDVHVPRIRGTYLVSHALWDALPDAAAGDDSDEADRIPLLTQGLIGVLGLGKSSSDVPLIAYEGGFTGLAAATVEVFTIG